MPSKIMQNLPKSKWFLMCTTGNLEFLFKKSWFSRKFWKKKIGPKHLVDLPMARSRSVDQTPRMSLGVLTREVCSKFFPVFFRSFFYCGSNSKSFKQKKGMCWNTCLHILWTNLCWKVELALNVISTFFKNSPVVIFSTKSSSLPCSGRRYNHS